MALLINQPFLKPLTGDAKRKRVAVFDIESKDGDTQKAGFTRPFLAAFYDGEQCVSFRNDPEVQKLPWEHRHIADGGCIDKLLRHIFGLSGCEKCGAQKDFHRYRLEGFTPMSAAAKVGLRLSRRCTCAKLFKRYSNKEFLVYSHNGGKFDELFLLGWLISHRDLVRFDLASVQSRIQRLDVYRTGKQKAAVTWTFLDSYSLLPVSLRKMGATFKRDGDAEEESLKGNIDLDAPEESTVVYVDESSDFRVADVYSVEPYEPVTLLKGSCFYYWRKPTIGKQSNRHRWCAKKKLVVEAEEREHFIDAEISGKFADGDILCLGIQQDELRRRRPKVGKTWDAWEKYNNQDCKVLHKSLIAFHTLIEGLGGEVGITAPSTSMKLYRRAFLKTWIHRNQHFPGCDGKCDYSRGLDERGNQKVCHMESCDGSCHCCLHDWVRRGYYGGRTELFHSFGHRIFYYDINSSYPASMLDEMPIGPAVVETKVTSEHLLAPLAKNHVGFVECIVEIPKGCPIPPLPFRYRSKLIFPTGKFSGVWSWTELQLLKHPLVQGRIVSISKSVWYKKKPIFREMVTKLYSYRQKHLKQCGGSKACPKPYSWGCKPDYLEGMSYVAKLMLNSLYGKFGMREERTGVVMVPEGSAPPKNGWPINGRLDSLFWECENVCKASYIIPQISAHITALSRIRLWEGMAKVIERGGQVYYVDTDSVMCSVEIPESGELGGWKREEPHLLLEGEFVLPKLYQLKMHKLDCKNIFTWDGKNRCPGCGVSSEGKFGSIQKMKGVPGKMQTPAVWDDMVHNEGTARFTRLMQHRSMINSAKLSPEIVDASKSIRTQYDKRHLRRDGSTTAIHVVWKGK